MSLGTFTSKVHETECFLKMKYWKIVFWSSSFSIDIVIQCFISFSTLGKYITKGFELKFSDLQLCLCSSVSISHLAHTPAKVRTKQRDRYGCICCSCLKIFKGIQISSIPTKHFDKNIRQLILPQTFHWLTGVHTSRPSETFFLRRLPSHFRYYRLTSLLI